MDQTRPLFVYFRSFQTIYRIKTVDFSRIRTWMHRIEDENADHLTTTNAEPLECLATIIFTVALEPCHTSFYDCFESFYHFFIHLVKL